MSPLLRRDSLRRKRRIHSKASRALGQLEQNLLDMKLFLATIRPQYVAAGLRNEVVECDRLLRMVEDIEIKNKGHSIRDLLITFNSLAEDE